MASISKPPGDLNAAYLAAIVASSNDAIVGKNLDGIVTFWNAASERIFGYSAAEMVGESITKVIPPDRLSEEEVILAILRQGRKIEHYETKRLTKAGKLIDVSLSISPIRDAKGDIVGASKIARDITEKRAADATAKALREELARASRLSALGEMSAAIAHEINQPLCAIGNYLNAATALLGGSSKDVETARGVLQKAKDQSARASGIVENLRNIAVNREPTKSFENINSLAEEAIHLAVSSTPVPDLKLSLTFDHDLPPVHVNKVQIQQVLFNLGRNSLEAMKTVNRRELNVKTSRDEGEFIAVTVQDSGPGLPQEIADRLFQPLVTTKGEGMGMGLRVSHTIVQSHGGSLKMCGHPHRGACFEIRLPSTGTLVAV